MIALDDDIMLQRMLSI